MLNKILTAYSSIRVRPDLERQRASHAMTHISNQLHSNRMLRKYYWVNISKLH